METRANYFLVGLFTIAGLLIALGIGLWTSKYTSDSDWQEYEIHFTHSVTGLTVGSVVQYNGINVGTVRELSLAPDDPGKAIARVRIEAGVPIREDTVARLTMTGVTGVALIQLTGGSVDSPRLSPQPGEEYARIPAEPSALQQLMASSEDIASAASEIMIRLLSILSEDNTERVASILDNIDTLSRSLILDEDLIEETARNVHQASDGINRLVGDLEKLLVRVDGTLTTVDTGLSEELPAMSAELKATLRNLAATAERAERILADNEQALADFGAEGLSRVGPTLEEARQLLREMSRIGQRLERNPAGFILGGERPEEYHPR